MDGQWVIAKGMCSINASGIDTDMAGCELVGGQCMRRGTV